MNTFQAVEAHLASYVPHHLAKLYCLANDIETNVTQLLQDAAAYRANPPPQVDRLLSRVRLEDIFVDIGCYVGGPRVDWFGLQQVHQRGPFNRRAGHFIMVFNGGRESDPVFVQYP